MNRHFLDTNVVIYAYSNTEIEKSNRANELLFNDHSIISTQVVNEFSNVCLRKFRQPEQTITKTLLELARTTTIANFSLATQPVGCGEARTASYEHVSFPRSSVGMHTALRRSQIWVPTETVGTRNNAIIPCQTPTTY